VRQARDAIRALSKSVRKRLEGVAHMDADEIRKALREEVLLETQDELRILRREKLERSEQDLNNEAKRILIAAMQRLASKPNNDITATIVHLPSEEMKGRIIGREGRNIKAFEAATGVTLLIDESPQLVLISSFDPVRREVARAALDALIKTGGSTRRRSRSSSARAGGDRPLHPAVRRGRRASGWASTACIPR